MKRLFCLIIALTMVICMVPETVGIAFADDEPVVLDAAEQTLTEKAVQEAEITETAEAAEITETTDEEAVSEEAATVQEEGNEDAADVVTEKEEETPSEEVAMVQISKTSKAAQEEGVEPPVQETPQTVTDPAQDQQTPETVPDASAVTPETVPEEPVIIDITDATVKLSRTVYKFTGKEKTPKVVSVTLKDGTVVDPAGYTVKYSKNTKAGTAKVKVSGIKEANVTGKAYAEFTILGEVEGFALTGKKARSATFGWEAYTASEFRGYKIFRYNKSKKEYVEVKTIKGADKLTAKIFKLEHSTTYKFKIAVYSKDTTTGEIFVGPKTDALVAKTAPVAPKEKTKLTSLYNKAPYVQVKWKNIGKKNANRYQIQYSRSSSFKDAVTVTVKTTKATSKRIYGLRSYTRYYFRVRAGKAYGGDEEYGKWSSSKSVVAHSTGWTTYKGRQYYYVNGRTLKGTQTLNGNPYYFDTKTGEFHGCSSLIWKKVQQAGSDTRSIVTIDCAKHRLNVFRKKGKDWVCIKQWICSTGQTEVNGDYKKTPKGIFKLRYKLKHFGEEHGYTCWYASNFSGNSFIHSVLYNPMSMTSIQDGRLGINASHGCVRLKLQNAKWIYEHVKKGSTIICVNGTV